MSRNDVYDLICMLAKEQGFYGRMLHEIEELDEDSKERFWFFIEKLDFKDPLEFVMWAEG